jgi:hypothetical protein
LSSWTCYCWGQGRLQHYQLELKIGGVVEVRLQHLQLWQRVLQQRPEKHLQQQPQQQHLQLKAGRMVAVLLQLMTLQSRWKQWVMALVAKLLVWQH